MKIVVTGATGYIGQKLVAALSKDNQVFALVRENSDRSQIKEYVKEFILYHDQNIYRDMERIQPDLVVHLAGVFYSVHSQENIKALLEANIVFGTVVLDAAVSCGCRNIINTASYWQNYGGEEYNPVNLYAATKQSMEDILRFYIHARNCRAITLQIFDTYGKDDHRNKLFNRLRDMKDGESIDMSGGGQKLYFCHIDDVVNGYIKAIQLLDRMSYGQYKKYALRGEYPIELKKLVEAYLKAANKKIQVNWGRVAYREREIMDPSGIGEVLPEWKISKLNIFFKERWE